MKAVDYLYKANKIHISGIVQGVGYRPFVYRIAQPLGIKGWVNNSSDGVNIHAEAEEFFLEKFYHILNNEKPPLATVISITKNETALLNYEDFRIFESKEADKNDVLISADVATCNDCLREMFDKNDRRFSYPFINCTNCGPRYTIIYDRPYDREKTTMKSFVMCEACHSEYTEPSDRRFHAQPVACQICGPELKLLDNQGTEIKDRGIGAELLKAGAVLAVKGLGGFQLVCDAYNDKTIRRLRSVKERGAKPFALMARSTETAETEVEISDMEKSILSSPSAPIVLLPKKNNKISKISKDAAPGLHTLGIMLPYTPVHHLLMAQGFDFLVMTSANLSGKPLIYENRVALEELKGIADYFLLHDRDIFHPCDDSVVQIVGGKLTFMRRARGYVPVPLILENNLKASIAALGGEMKNAFCLAAGNMAFMSQYIGDMHGYENMERFKQEYSSYQKVANVFPKIAACDLHPEYSTTKIAETMDCLKIPVQHHHAHLVSVMGEYGLKEPMLGIICDGTGYGEDGNIWGFEYLFGNAGSYERRGHLEYLPLPGGDAAAKRPLRIAYAYCRHSLANEEWLMAESLWDNLSDQERSILDSQLKYKIRIFETSSAGRLFDAISGLLGICTEVTYEGQAAIELESTAVIWQKKFFAGQIVQNIKNDALKRLGCTMKSFNDGNVESGKWLKDKFTLIEKYNKVLLGNKQLYPIWLDVNSEGVTLKINRLLQNVITDYLDKVSIGEIAFRFHYSLALAMMETAIITGIKDRKVVIGGGVFQNKLLTNILLVLAKEADIEIFYPVKLPSGDGGLALGQVLIANEHIFC